MQGSSAHVRQVAAENGTLLPRTCSWREQGGLACKVSMRTKKTRPVMEPSLLMMEPKASINSRRSRLPPPSVSAASKRSFSERIWVMEIELPSDSLLPSCEAACSSLPSLRDGKDKGDVHSAKPKHAGQSTHPRWRTQSCGMQDRTMMSDRQGGRQARTALVVDLRCCPWPWVSPCPPQTRPLSCEGSLRTRPF